MQCHLLWETHRLKRIEGGRRCDGRETLATDAYIDFVLVKRLLSVGKMCLLGLASESFAISPWAPEVAVPFDQCNGRGYFFIPFAHTSTHQTRTFSVVGHSVWNGLLLAQRLPPRVHSDTFYSSLKTALFIGARVGSASE